MGSPKFIFSARGWLVDAFGLDIDDEFLHPSVKHDGEPVVQGSQQRRFDPSSEGRRMMRPVLEVAEQRAEAGSTRHAPLGRRVVATLESARSILNTDRIPDEGLRRIRDGDRHAALRQVELTTAAAVSSLASGPSRTVRVLSNPDIANELVISEHTVKSHVKHILRKMHAANRVQAVSCYMRLQALSKN